MSGYTIKKVDVIKTKLVNVVCNNCQGICFSSLADDDNYYYICKSCGIKHLNSTGERYSEVEYETQ